MAIPPSSSFSGPSVAVVGAGSIGGYVGFELARAGASVSLCVRSPFDTLIVDDQYGERHTLTMPVFRSADTVKVADWVMLATKAHQTDAAAPMLRAAAGLRDSRQAKAVVVMQNGVEHLARVQPLVDRVPVLPCIVRCGAEAIAPGHIVHHGFATFEVPRSDLAAELAAVFAPSKLDLLQVDDFTTLAWQKLISNITCSPMTALTTRRLEILRDDDIAQLAVDLTRECIKVAAAEGAQLDVAQAEGFVEGMRTVNPAMGSSMMYDRVAGRPMEYEALTGAVVRGGRRHCIQTPLNDAMYALLKVTSAEWQGEARPTQ